MLEGGLEALGVLADPAFLGLIIFATVVGTIAAILPGISPGTMMALLIPITFGMGRFEAFGFLVALMAAGGFAGSMTSILLNVPGDGINAATTLDGFPMARQGRAGIAIGASATASGLGALFGAVILIASIPVMREAVLFFGPPEFFALAIAGVTLIATVSARSPLKGITAGVIGMAIGFVGVNFTVGGTRYTFDQPLLEDGIRLVPALIGLFAIPELFNLVKRNQTISSTGYAVKGGVLQGIREVLRRPVLLLRSSAIGTLIGIIPGVGGSVASWVAYFAAQNSSKDPDSFGKGNVEGVIAPEASIDAKEGGSLMPVLALGLPASVSTAILVTAFQIHGVFPGERLFNQDMALVWVMVLSMIFANLTTSALGLLFANQMVKITLISSVVLAPFIFALGAIGSFADQRSLFGLVLMLGFGALGIVMTRFGFPRPPLLVGMILLPLAETNFFRSVQIYRGELDWLLRPLTLIILGLVVVAILIPFIRQRLRERRASRSRAPMVGEAEEDSSRIWLPGQLAFLLFLIAVAGWMLLEAFSFPDGARLFPQMTLSVLLVLLAALVMRTVLMLRSQRRADAAPAAPTADARVPDEAGDAAAGTLAAADAAAVLDPVAERPPEDSAAPVRPGGRDRAEGFVRSLRLERPDWWVAAWLGVLLLLVWVFGVLAGTSLYIILFLLAFVPRVPRPVTVVGAAVSAAVFFVSMNYAFVEALGVRFYGGLFS